LIATRGVVTPPSRRHLKSGPKLISILVLPLRQEACVGRDELSFLLLRPPPAPGPTHPFFPFLPEGLINAASEGEGGKEASTGPRRYNHSKLWSVYFGYYVRPK
jgi:hypothetical protein